MDAPVSGRPGAPLIQAPSRVQPRAMRLAPLPRSTIRILRDLSGAFALGLAVLAGSARASEKDVKDATAVQYVNISPIAAPIIYKGKIVNYVFLTTRLVLKPGADAIRLRDREPYFRDALVRDASRHPFLKPGDYVHVDEGAVIRTLRADAERIAGPGQIAGVEIVSAQARRTRVFIGGGTGGDRPPTP